VYEFSRKLPGVDPLYFWITAEPNESSHLKSKVSRVLFILVDGTSQTAIEASKSQEHVNSWLGVIFEPRG
jgi:hypothetical protein